MNKSSRLAIGILFITALAFGLIVYTNWKKPDQKVVQKVVPFENRDSRPILKMDERETAPQKGEDVVEEGMSSPAQLPEGRVVRFSEGYTLLKSEELHRRGSFVSYVFDRLGYSNYPELDEIQFFSEESIREFISNCGEGNICFFGDQPDLPRYIGQKKAFSEGVDYEGYVLKTFGNRRWFVKNIPASGDDVIIREYTTFFGELKVDVWITMADKSQETKADELFVQFSIE